ncbi:unnamed protein product [Diamesa serratosioi]
MDKLIIPPNPNWYMQEACCCTPDDGFMYGAMSKIAYIPPKSKPELKIRTFELEAKLQGFSLDPDWNELKRFAVISGDFIVSLYDFNTGNITQGHRGHANENQRYTGNNNLSTISFSGHNKIISTVNSNLISFCLLTNSFKIYLDFSSHNPITILKQSPKEPKIMAAGTKNGLILLFDTEKVEVLFKLRGHDKEITSLDWMYFPIENASTVVRTPKNTPIKKNKPPPPDNDADLFDVYSFDHLENEFGEYRQKNKDVSDDEESNNADLKEKLQENADFNFLEACTSLKGQIMGDEEKCNKNIDKSKKTFEENKEQYGLEKNDGSIDDSMESNASSITPVFTDESPDEGQKLKDFVVVTKPEAIIAVDYFPILASGAMEQSVWLWDVNGKVALTKTNYHPSKKRSSLPSPFTNVLWIDLQTLIITDFNGDLFEYKVEFSSIEKSMVLEKKEKTFPSKAVLNICKNKDSSIIWTSSLHRHIDCIEFLTSELLVSLDTLQLCIHQLTENPFDSNVIAVGGNDKRILLWNTSEASQSTITLKPFMSKIHSAILEMAWHPVKDSIIALCTREGRVVVLDTNKSNNVPTVLPSFTSYAIYSLAWGNLIVDGKETPIIMASDRNTFAYYIQKGDQWKFKSIHKLANTSSFVKNGYFLAVGKENGTLAICDMSKDFAILFEKKVCKKYVGQMAWFGSKLAVGTENNILIINDIDVLTGEILDSNIQNLVGHCNRTASVKFNKEGTLLVSCCFGGYVKIWDLKSLECLSSFNIKTQAYCAIFMPSNEEIVLCGGLESTILAFEWKKFPKTDKPDEVLLKQKSKPKAIEWAKNTEVTIITKANKRLIKKVVPKAAVADEAVGALADDLQNIKLTPKKTTTLFHIANREIVTNPLDFLQSTMFDDRKKTVSELIFGERSDVKKMVDEEFQNYKNFKLKSYGCIILPQLNDSLNTELMQRITSKTLTEAHVAVAPSVSFEMWKKCCAAFGTQCLENDDHLMAIQYFLACNENDKIIKQLCEGKFFREAWVIAKMRKEDADPIFTEIMKKWLGFFTECGNYESAAALLVCNKDFHGAVEALKKRQKKSVELVKIIELLSKKR